MTIVSLNYDEVLFDPLLTEQDQASLIIRDYEPGDFAFAADSFSCKEPNTDSTVPAELQPAAGGLLCELAVVRTDTSIYAPAAELSVSVSPVTANTGAADFTNTAALYWPALTETVTATPSSETQIITFTLVNDNYQEDDEQVVVSVLPSNGDGHDENVTAASATLTLVDVTSPALLTVEDTSATVYEGQLLTVDIDRAGNPETDFTVVRSVEVLNKTSGKTDADYLSFSYSDPAGSTGALSFSYGGIPVSSQLVIRTKDVLFNGNSNYTVRVTLSDPQPTRTVGLGALSNANQDSSVNQTYRDFVITNDNSVNDQILVTQSAVNNNATSVAGTYYAIDDFLGASGQVDLSVVIPERTGVNKKHAQINYTWSLLSSNGATLGNTGGSFAYADGMAEAARSFSTRLTLPFTYQNQINSQILLTVWGGPDSNIANADEVYEQILNIRSAPRWRRLIFEGSRCVAWDEGDERYEANNCSASVLNAELWTYDPQNQYMINKGDNACATNDGDLLRTDCNSGPKTWELTNDNGSLNVKETGGSEIWCRISTGQQINVRDTGLFSCSGNDDRYTWGVDQ